MITTTHNAVDAHPASRDGDCCDPWYETEKAGLQSHDYVGFMMLLGFAIGILLVEVWALFFHTPHFTVVLGTLA